MDNEWQRNFRNRLHDFEAKHRRPPGTVPVSIKIRVNLGCYHREHSPHAYSFIDKYLNELGTYDDFTFEEHESGPELLVFVATTTAGISLAKSIIDLVIAIIKARSEGIKKGDRRTAPLELIVRRANDRGEFREEMVLRVEHGETINQEVIEECLRQSISVLLRKEEDKPTSQTQHKAGRG